jgi:surface antigen
MEAVSQLTASASEPAAAAPPPLAERRLAPPPFVPVAPRAMPPVEEHPPMATPVVAPAEAPSAAETPAPAVTASLPPSAVAKEAPQPLEQVKANPADPLQVRAEAAGLHPGLSRVLLESLTAEDYRNAGYAVRTALAQTPDSAVFVWPRKQTAGQAVFKVHFVAGAETDCRRYVVTVIKNRWATTARPMEKCGVPQPAQHRVTSNRPRQGPPASCGWPGPRRRGSPAPH